MDALILLIMLGFLGAALYKAGKSLGSRQGYGVGRAQRRGRR